MFGQHSPHSPPAPRGRSELVSSLDLPCRMLRRCCPYLASTWLPSVRSHTMAGKTWHPSLRDSSPTFLVRKNHAQSKSNKVIAAKKKKGSHGFECEEHLWDRPRVTILIHEVDAHDNASFQGSDTKWENLSIDQVLDTVPAHTPESASNLKGCHCVVPNLNIVQFPIAARLPFLPVHFHRLLILRREATPSIKLTSKFHCCLQVRLVFVAPGVSGFLNCPHCLHIMCI